MRQTELMKSHKENIPVHISLDQAHRTVVGRRPTGTEDERLVTLFSNKFPSMVSRCHAALAYDHVQKNWTVEDIKVRTLGRDEGSWVKLVRP